MLENLRTLAARSRLRALLARAPRSARLAALLVALTVLWGCSGDDGGGGTPVATPSGAAPAGRMSSFAMVDGARAGFTRPSGLAIRKDGTRLYFTARRAADDEPALYAYDLSTQAVSLIWAGAPLSEPVGIAAAPDGSALYVADLTAATGGELSGAVLRFPLGGRGEPSAVFAPDALDLPGGVALDRLGARLYVTGTTPDGLPALFSANPGGTALKVLHAGAPFEDPGAVLVEADQQSVLVLDRAAGAGSAPRLFRVPLAGGEPVPVAPALAESLAGGLAADPFGLDVYVSAGGGPEGWAGVLALKGDAVPRRVTGGLPHAEPAALVQSPVSPSTMFAADAEGESGAGAILSILR